MNHIKINFSRHARERIEKKSISELEVRQTVLNPDTWYYGEHEEINAVKNFGIKKNRVPYMILLIYSFF